LAIVDIVDVSSRDLSEDQLWGCNIDLAIPQNQDEAHALTLIGWVLGRRSPTVAVEIVCNGSLVSRVPVNVRRPDIITAFPDIPGAEQTGFQTTFELSQAEPEFELLVHAVFRDDSRVEIGVVRGRHTSLGTEVEEVSPLSTQSLEPRLWGCNIDRPVPAGHSELYAISVEGWVLGRTSPAIAVELVSETLEVVGDKVAFRRIPINVQRPDIVSQYPTVPEAGNCGFRATASVLELPRNVELQFRAVLQDGSQMPIGGLQARRRPLRSTFKPDLQPLMLTTTGRSGSTWLTNLLGQHAQIITYRPYEFEPRVASYWMQILGTLSDPMSYLQLLDVDVSSRYWWLGSAPPLVGSVSDSHIQHQLGRNAIEELMEFCQRRIEQFYKQIVTTRQYESTLVYFAERCNSRFTKMMMRELYPHAREIFLVRDFRDMLCSIFAYNKKHNVVRFGRERASSDRDFVRQIGDQLRSMLKDWQESSEQSYLIRYEDLVQHPEETLTSVLDFLDLASDPSTVRRVVRTEAEQASRLHGRHKTSASAMTSIGRWRRDLDPSLQAVCRAAFSDVLQGFGYAE
jgi:hypothetical protein